MLIRCFGALMLLGTCGGVGLRCSGELRRRVRTLRLLLDKLERMHTEICSLATPLPELLPLLTGTALDALELRERSFREIWAREIGRLGLWPEERSAMEVLGCALSRGDEPERSFAAARERLLSLLRTAEAEAENKCRLCSALGICTGLLLVIVLI